MKVIPVTYKEERFHTMVDDQDYESLRQFTWYKRMSGYNQYAVRYFWDSERKQMIPRQMHRDILGLEDPEIIVDHLDRNGLNNQKENLRVTTTSNNTLNQRTRKSSNIRGIFKTPYDTWNVRFQVDKKRYNIGTYPSLNTAVYALEESLLEFNLDPEWWFSDTEWHGVTSAKALDVTGTPRQPPKP